MSPGEKDARAHRVSRDQSRAPPTSGPSARMLHALKHIQKCKKKIKIIIII